MNPAIRMLLLFNLYSSGLIPPVGSLLLISDAGADFTSDSGDFFITD